MADAETDLGDKLSLQELPNEVWLDILEFATAVRDPFVHPTRTRKSAGYEFSDGAARRYRDSMAVKLAVVQVCRQWNSMATRFLYEHLAPSNNKRLEAVLEAVTTLPTVRAPDDERTLGFFVKRLDVTFDDLYWCSEPSGKEEESNQPPVDAPSHEPAPIVRLCRALPNLLSFTFTSSDNSECLATLPFSDIMARGIEYLDSRNNFSIPTSEMLKLLATHQNLVSFDPPFIDANEADHEIDSQIQRMHSQGATFPVQELVIHAIRQCTRWITKLPAEMLPRLERLVFVYAVQPTDTEVKDFLAAHGGNLTSVHIRIDDEYLDGHLHSWYTLLQTHCPRLNEVCLITQEEVPSLLSMSVPPIYPKIKTFGVQHIGTDGRDESSAGEWGGWRDFLDAVTCRAASFPGLRTIRLMDENNLDGFMSDVCVDRFTAFLQDWQSRGVKVVDVHGKYLN